MVACSSLISPTAHAARGMAWRKGEAAGAFGASPASHHRLLPSSSSSSSFLWVIAAAVAAVDAGRKRRWR